MFNLKFVEVASLEELREIKKKIVEVKGQVIGLFFLDGRVYAINGTCPHKGGPLCEGELDSEEIVCPWHSFMFNIKTGICLNHPGFSVRTYKTKVDNGKVMLSLD